MKDLNFLLKLIFLVPFFQGPNLVRAATKSVLRVAAASDLRFALPEIAQEFSKKHPQLEVSPVFGASGPLLIQIQQGAPFDLFLSADIDRPQSICSQHLSEGDSFPYSVGHLVLWVPKDSPLDISVGLKVLENESVHRIAIANPEHAPYGKLAMTILGARAEAEKIRKKIVYGEDVAQAAQWTENHAADVGLIAQSLAQSRPLAHSGRLQTLGAEDRPLTQAGVILQRSEQKKQAMEFRDFLLSPQGQQILKKYGLGLNN